MSALVTCGASASSDWSYPTPLTGVRELMTNDNSGFAEYSIFYGEIFEIEEEIGTEIYINTAESNARPN